MSVLLIKRATLAGSRKSSSLRGSELDNGNGEIGGNGESEDVGGTRPTDDGAVGGA